MGPDYIGPVVDHFQEITAQYPEVKTPRNEQLEFLIQRVTRYQLLIPIASKLSVLVALVCLIE